MYCSFLDVAYPVKDVKVISNYGNIQISWRPSAKSIFGGRYKRHVKYRI